MSGAVAIVGMACRFPDADDISSYWRLILDGHVVNRSVSRTRWDHAPFFAPGDPRAADAAYTDRVAHLDDVASFPALHHGMPPRRLEVTDPQQRLLIELTRVALQDAGLDHGAPSPRTGVYIGASVSEYKDIMLSRLRAVQFGLPDAAAGITPLRPYSLPGMLLNMTAAAVSSAFDLRGPSFVVDAACSSSLVAVHEAMLHLRGGQCDLALAGGVYLNLLPDTLVAFSRIGAVSQAGVCRPFDRRADGFVLGEGAGVVVLKRLADARRDGDRVHAVIVGGASTSDGRAEGPMTPSAAGQLACLRDAYADAGVRPDEVSFVECHGTATPVGDSVELAALRQIRQGAGCHVASVKANVGHTMAAAGVAGLIKTALVLRHGLIPRQPACEEPAAEGFAVAGSPVPFTGLAAVSSFGFGGTNAHLVLAAADEIGPPPAPAGPLPFALTADNHQLLLQHARELAEVVGEHALADVSYTLSTRKPLHANAFVVANDPAELIAKLRRAAWDEPIPTPHGRYGRLVSLPASPLETARYWATAEHEPADDSAIDSANEHVADILAAVASASEYPVRALKLNLSLVNDLGFDSIMLAELAEKLGNRWPHLPALPQGMYRPDTTIGDLADWVSRPIATTAHTDQHPLADLYFQVNDGVLGAHTTVSGRRMLSFSGYDYLGLNGDPAVCAAAKQAIDRDGTSSSASRAASGEKPVHGQLEEAIAAHLGVAAALVFVSGYATNVAVLGHHLGPGDLILHDALAHNSIVAGAQLSGAARRAFPHNDNNALAAILAELRPRYRKVLVAVEGVYSMDGDLADLPALLKLRHEHDFELYVDEAHSIGVLGSHGRGAAQHWGIDPSECDIWMGTLSKAFSSCGGYVAGAAGLIKELRQTTPGFLYSVGLPPPSAAAALAALRRLQAEPGLAATARNRAALFRGLCGKAGLNTGLATDGAAVVPVILPDAETALRLARGLAQRDINVQPFIPPAVESARLRFFLTAAHEEAEIQATVAAIVEILNT